MILKLIGFDKFTLMFFQLCFLIIPTRFKVSEDRFLIHKYCKNFPLALIALKQKFSSIQNYFRFSSLNLQLKILVSGWSIQNLVPKLKVMNFVTSATFLWNSVVNLALTLHHAKAWHSSRSPDVDDLVIVACFADQIASSVETTSMLIRGI